GIVPVHGSVVVADDCRPGHEFELGVGGGELAAPAPLNPLKKFQGMDCMSSSESVCIKVREYPGGIVAIDSGLVRNEMAACYLLEAGDKVAIIEAGSYHSVERILKVLL